MGPVPKNIVMLTADAFGVLPPIARLTPDQAMYHFLSGYTAKVAGTEIGVTEPEATFSTCFGAPFMPRHPSVYGNLLKERIAKGGVDCWLVNTGWTGGKYGVGKRMPIKATRALLNAALDGSLKNAEFRKDPNFGFDVPVAVPGVDSASSIRARPGRTRTTTTARRPSSSTCSSRISRNSSPRRRRRPTSRAARSPRPPRSRGPVIGSGPPKDPINDRIPTRLFATDADRRIGEGLLARTLPRADWTHEAHLAATTYLLPRRPDIDLDQRLPGIIRRYNESVGGVNNDTAGLSRDDHARCSCTASACSCARRTGRAAASSWSTSCCGRRWDGATGRCASTAPSGCSQVEARRPSCAGPC